VVETPRISGPYDYFVFDRFARRFEAPDEVIEADGLRHELVDLGGVSLARDTHQPGWRWATHVQPLVGTEWCEARHVGLVMRGRMHVITRDGDEFETNEGDLIDIPPGHDGWVVGDEPVVTITWMGARTWLLPLDSLRERVLVTLLFTDIVDSTGTARRVGDQRWTELLASHDQRLSDVVEQYRGRIVKHTGDGLLAIFDGAARALRCAATCRRAAADVGLTIRSAVHTGEVEVAGEEIRGIAVHEAARILEMAGAGEVILSSVTASLVDDSSFEFEDRGEHELRGLDNPRRLFELAAG
jgi:class 3 adenylate cyclase